MTFGCDESSGHFVYEYLLESGYLRWQAGIQITAKGFELIDNLRRGTGQESNKVFVVRRWDEELDLILKPACEIASNALKIEIEPVWVKPHNEKIDERVFRSLRQAIAVVVDLTPDPKNKATE